MKDAREIRRTDSLEIDRYIEYLEANGLVPKANALGSMKNRDRTNVAGVSTDGIPAILDSNIRLTEKVE